MRTKRHLGLWAAMFGVVGAFFAVASHDGTNPRPDPSKTQVAPTKEPLANTPPTPAPAVVEPLNSEESVVKERIAAVTHGVMGGKHDFSSLTGRPGDVCSACHVPHVQAVRPLKGEGESFALEFYRMGGQREVLVPDRFMPGPTSLNCLSCHNGTVAPSTVGSSHVILSAHRAGFEIGDFSTRDHPIGVLYPERKAGYKGRAALLATGRIPLPQGRVECVSCHDPHNAAGFEKMLVMSNRRSALCLACHEK